jgi:nuclear pore complex protein Nup93
VLAASGISPGQALHDLRILDTQTTVSSPLKHADTFDPDNQKFLRRVQQRGRDAMIAESLARVRRDFDAFLEEKVNLNWEEQRQKIYEHFGLNYGAAALADTPDPTAKGSFGRATAASGSRAGFGSSRGYASATRRSVFGRSGLDKSVIGYPGDGAASSQLFTDPVTRSDGANIQSPDTRLLREKIGYFAVKVQQLNEARLQEKVYPVLHEFADAEKLAGGDVCDFGLETLFIR